MWVYLSVESRLRSLILCILYARNIFQWLSYRFYYSWTTRRQVFYIFIWVIKNRFFDQMWNFIRFGRRPVLLYSFLFLIIGSFGSALAINERENFLKGYLFYSLSRFLTGVGTRGINVTGYVLGNHGHFLISSIRTYFS